MIANNIEQIAKDFENYVKKFDELREIALKFKTTPGLLTDMFFKIGLEALTRTEAILHKEFEIKLTKFSEDLKKNKRASGRLQDLADIENLE